MMSQSVSIVFPHQLFKDNPCLKKGNEVYLVEEHLFFKQYHFHKSKIAFHRASMKFYENHLHQNKYKTIYVEALDKKSDVRVLINALLGKGIKKISICALSDYLLDRRLTAACTKANIEIEVHESDYFVNTDTELRKYFDGRKRMHQTDFYVHQRKTRNILVDDIGQPQGGKWTFDTENRLKYPKAKTAPKIDHKKLNDFDKEAKKYIEENFDKNPGLIKFNYPTNFEESEKWLEQFLKIRFEEFGAYEDALVQNENILHHSVLSPLINAGLLTPKYVIDKIISFGLKHDIPLNSLEGLVRQILGWREFIKAVYIIKGVEERTMNFWNHKRKIPASFYDGTTGILPIDNVIKKVLDTGYAHHIERLMVLGNFMLLCEFDPDEVYRWFMELFIDAYDWVMVPNIYGMSQFADGGMMATKPYISGSNYLMKMSDYPKGDWQAIWDGLFWNFMDKNRTYMNKNPRLGMLVTMFDKMDDEKRNKHLSNAMDYLSSLDGKG
jgi:deoxyribodipyrimidine photolyase-related protein